MVDIVTTALEILDILGYPDVYTIKDMVAEKKGTMPVGLKPH
jgi:hypothetical protein